MKTTILLHEKENIYLIMVISTRNVSNISSYLTDCTQFNVDHHWDHFTSLHTQQVPFIWNNEWLVLSTKKINIKMSSCHRRGRSIKHFGDTLHHTGQIYCFTEYWNEFIDNMRHTEEISYPYNQFCGISDIEDTSNVVCDKLRWGLTHLYLHPIKWVR